MDNVSLSNFMRSRGIEENIVKYFDSENVDSKALISMPEDDLKTHIPKYGDRVAIISYCKKLNSCKKQSLIEKLKEKMSNNRGSKTEKSGTKYQRRKKQTRFIEVGWLCIHSKFKDLRYVRSRYGGGTRRISVDQNINCKEILEKATVLFFRNGHSPKGNISKFNVQLLDYQHQECNLNLTVREMYDISALTTLRFYLATTYKDGIVILDEENEDDHFTPSTSVAHQQALPLRRSRRKHVKYSPSLEKNYEIQTDTNFEFSDEVDNDINSYSYVEEEEVDHSIPFISTESTEIATTNNIQPDSSFLLSTQNLQIFLQTGLDDLEQSVDNIQMAMQTSPINSSFPEVLGPPENSFTETTLILHRGNIFDDLLKAFEQHFFDTSHFKIELILPTGEKELAEDLGGVWRDVLSEFWYTFYEKCTIGTTMKVPHIRHDFGECQWRAVAKIFLKGFTMEKYLPIKVAPVFLKACFNLTINDDDLISDFHNYVCETDRKTFEQALTNFDEVDLDELIDIFSTYELKWNPTKHNLKQLLRDIAHKELIQKPAFVIKCFQKEWEGKHISYNDMFTLYEKITPTVKNCLQNIVLENSNITSEQNSIFNYLKKYIKEADGNTREAFFRYCTGSNLPIMVIKVDFIDTTGNCRVPIAHTCSGLLQLPSTYEHFVNLRSELNSLLSSNVWIMDLV